jgi:CP family cyanate transporter-like MFS transporter
MQEERDLRMPGSVLAIALLTAFATWAPLLIVPPLEADIAAVLNISHAQGSLLLSGPILVLALAAIPAGFLADRFGLKKTIGAGIVVIALGSGLRGVVSTFAALMAFTLLYGLGIGLAFPNLPKLARHCGARARAYITVGLFSSAVLGSGAVVLVLTRPLIYPLTGSFQGTALVWAVPAVVAAVLWWALIKDPPCETAGVESMAFDLAALRRVVTRSELWLVAALFFLHNFFLYTFIGWEPEYLVSLGATPSLASSITSAGFWVGIPSVMALTQLSNRLGRRKPFLWVPSIVLGICAAWSLCVSVPLSWALMALVGISTSVRFSTILSLPVEITSAREGGSAAGLVMAVGYIGALAGPLTGGLILDRMEKYNLIFISLAAVSALTIIVSFLVLETGHKGKPRAPRRATRG